METDSKLKSCPLSELQTMICRSESPQMDNSHILDTTRVKKLIRIIGFNNQQLTDENLALRGKSAVDKALHEHEIEIEIRQEEKIALIDLNSEQGKENEKLKTRLKRFETENPVGIEWIINDHEKMEEENEKLKAQLQEELQLREQLEGGCEAQMDEIDRLQAELKAWKSENIDDKILKEVDALRAKQIDALFYKITTEKLQGENKSLRAILKDCYGHTVELKESKPEQNTSSGKGEL